MLASFRGARIGFVLSTAPVSGMPLAVDHSGEEAAGVIPSGEVITSRISFPASGSGDKLVPGGGTRSDRHKLAGMSALALSPFLREVAFAFCRYQGMHRQTRHTTLRFFRLFLVTTFFPLLLVLIYFPWATDAPLSAREQGDLQNFYADAYSKRDAVADDDENSSYVKIAQAAAEAQNVTANVKAFVEKYRLQDKKALDIGAGRGYLQDVVEDYTGLDISPSAMRFFHKRFVLGSATLMPLGTGEFDAAWSIWVLEHVPNPEAALAEMRRVVKNDGLLYLFPAWDCTPFAANGYNVRPYRDFGIVGKIEKASIPVQTITWGLANIPVRTLRIANRKVVSGPTKFRYRRLTPNYQQYWEADSDAVNSLDREETAMWFESRGDECLNCQTDEIGWVHSTGPLIVRIRK